MAFIPIKSLARLRAEIPGMSSTRLYHCLRTVREDGPYQSLVRLKFLGCEMTSKECVHKPVTDFDILMDDDSAQTHGLRKGCIGLHCLLYRMKYICSPSVKDF